ncbi:MAG: hypothetical protein JWP87_5136 [Labilithrix sp.]|nr:hypothetical protein [Labilithrix sp.]
MFRARLLFVAIFSLLLACSGTGTSDTLSPITGVTIRAESLTASRGCGRGTTQIFKYAVVILGRNPSSTGTFDVFIAGNVYDCFSDAQFVSLPASANSFEYDVQVYAYNEAAYQAAGGDAVVKPAAVNPTALPRTNPTLTTTCTAQQIPEVQSLAVCKPFSVGTGAFGTPAQPATVVLSAGSFARGDGGVVVCDTDYASVRYRSGAGGALGAITEARCSHLTDKGIEPITITVSPADAPASYTIEVALLRADGTALGQTTCGAETSPGITSSAVCQPIP